MQNFDLQKVNFSEKLSRSSSETFYSYNSKNKKWIVKHIVSKDIKQLLIHIQRIILSFNCDNLYIQSINGYQIDFDEKRKLWNIYTKTSKMDNSLKSILTRHKADNQQIPEQDIIKYFYAMAKGLHYLHEKGIVHGDLRPDNILINDNGEIKMTGFGLRSLMDSEEASLAVEKTGALYYMAPELDDMEIELKKKELFKTDLWSLGMILLEICTLDLKFFNLFSSAKKKETSLVKKIQELEGKYSKDLLKLVTDLLRGEPDERKSLKEIQKELENKFGNVLENMMYLEKSDVKEMKKELEAKEIIMMEMERSYQEILSGVRIIKEEQPKIPEYKKTVVMLKQELDEKWRNMFKFENYTEKGISVKLEDYEILKKDTIKNLMQDLSLMNQCEDYETLGHLTFDLSGWYSNELNNAIQQIGEKIGSDMKNLFELDIDISVYPEDGYVTDETIAQFAQSLGENLTHLQKLSLNFSCVNGKISDDGIKALANQAISKLETIQTLAFNFSGNELVTDKGLKELSLQISSSLKNLRNLELSFQECPNITDVGIEDLVSHLAPNIKELDCLNLYFSDCQKITDKGINQLSSMLGQHFKTLHHIELYFTDCHQITDEGLIKLTSQISLNLQALDHFELNLKNCTITDKGFMELALQLTSGLKSLQHLKLYFSGTQVTLPTKDLAIAHFESISDVEIRV